MSKKLPKRYVNEKAVKRALGIDSFRNVSKDKIMEFASLIPYMDKDVAPSVQLSCRICAWRVYRLPMDIL